MLLVLLFSLSFESNKRERVVLKGWLQLVLTQRYIVTIQNQTIKGQTLTVS
jgi:hypothetical protein